MRSLSFGELTTVSGGDASDFAWAPYVGAIVGGVAGCCFGAFLVAGLELADIAVAVICCNPAAAAGALLVPALAPLPIAATTLAGAAVGALVGTMVLLSQD